MASRGTAPLSRSTTSPSVSGSSKAVDEVSLAVSMGEVYAIVGESGCGKSTLAFSLLNVVPPPGVISSGDVRYRGRSVTEMSRKELNDLRAADVAIVFQAAMNALNPVITVGTQVGHILAAHPGLFPRQKRAGSTSSVFCSW